MSETDLKFGPEWLRALSAPRGGKANTSPPSSPGPAKFKLAEFRYGKEEMLALYSKEFPPPDGVQHLGPLVVDKSQEPLAFVPMNSEEQRVWQRGINSDSAIRVVTGSRGSLNGTGRGRGGVSERGRGRGRGGSVGAPYYSRGISYDEEMDPRVLRESGPPGLGSRTKSFERSQSTQGEGRGWGERGPPLERSAERDERGGASSPRKEQGRAATYNWRAPKGSEEEGDRWKALSNAERGSVTSRDKWGGQPQRAPWRKNAEGEWLDERGSSMGGSRPAWDHDRDREGMRRQWEEDHLPEWAVESSEDKGGSFDSAGAYHNALSDEEESAGHGIQEQEFNPPPGQSRSRHQSAGKDGRREDVDEYGSKMREKDLDLDHRLDDHEGPSRSNHPPHIHNYPLQNSLSSDGSNQPPSLNSHPPYTISHYPVSNSNRPSSNNPLHSHESQGPKNDHSSPPNQIPLHNGQAGQPGDPSPPMSTPFLDPQQRVSISSHNPSLSSHAPPRLSHAPPHSGHGPPLSSHAPPPSSRAPPISHKLTNHRQGVAVSLTSREEDNLSHMQSVADDLVAKLVEEDEMPASTGVNEGGMGVLAPPPGVFADPPKEEARDDQWYYTDPQGDVQGPFTSNEMSAWYKSGYFKDTLFLRRHCDDKFSQLGHLTRVFGRVPFLPGPTVPPLKVSELLTAQKAQAEREKRYEQQMQAQLMQKQMYDQQLRHQQVLQIIQKHESWNTLTPAQQHHLYVQQMLNMPPIPVSTLPVSGASSQPTSNSLMPEVPNRPRTTQQGTESSSRVPTIPSGHLEQTHGVPAQPIMSQESTLSSAPLVPPGQGMNIMPGLGLPLGGLSSSSTTTPNSAIPVLSSTSNTPNTASSASVSGSQDPIQAFVAQMSTTSSSTLPPTVGAGSSLTENSSSSQNTTSQTPAAPVSSDSPLQKLLLQLQRGGSGGSGVGGSTTAPSNISGLNLSGVNGGSLDKSPEQYDAIQSLVNQLNLQMQANNATTAQDDDERQQLDIERRRLEEKKHIEEERLHQHEIKMREDRQREEERRRELEEKNLRLEEELRKMQKEQHKKEEMMKKKGNQKTLQPLAQQTQQAVSEQPQNQRQKLQKQEEDQRKKEEKRQKNEEKRQEEDKRRKEEEGKRKVDEVKQRHEDKRKQDERKREDKEQQRLLQIHEEMRKAAALQDERQRMTKNENDERRKIAEEESLKRQQQQQQSAANIPVTTDPWMHNFKEVPSLAEIQKNQEMKDRKQRETEAKEEAKRQKEAAKREAEEKKQKEANMKWAAKVNQGVPQQSRKGGNTSSSAQQQQVIQPPIKSLLEIQKEEEKELKQRMEREQSERAAAISQLSLNAAGVWGTVQSLSWAGRASSVTAGQQATMPASQGGTQDNANSTAWASAAQPGSNSSGWEFPTNTISGGFWDTEPSVKSSAKALNSNGGSRSPVKAPPSLFSGPPPQQSTKPTAQYQNSQGGQAAKQGGNLVTQGGQPTRTGSKKGKKDDSETVKKIFSDNFGAGVPSDSFTQWCKGSLHSMKVHSSIDIPTFVGFLSEVESPYEVHDYIRSYLGDTKEVKEFARQYLERRSKARNAHKERNYEDDILAPAKAVNPISNNEFQEVKTRLKKGGKKKMQKVDNSILGFNVAPSNMNNIEGN